MKNKAIVLVVVVLAFVIGIFVGRSVSAPTAPAGDELSTEAAFEFRGEGQQTLGPVKLSSGLTVLHVKNLMGANNTFTVTVSKDENGDGQLAEGEGWTGVGIDVGYERAENYKGSIAFKADEAQYFIYIKGGRWEIKVEQPQKLSSQADNFSQASGRGDGVTEKFFLEEGAHKFKVKHNGGSNFIVYLADENGNFTSRLVNEIGEVDLEFTYDAVFADNYVFVVRADGNWLIEEVK